MELPSEIPEDKFRALVETLADKARKMGLYLNGVMVNVDQHEPEEGEEGDTIERHHALIMQFTLGEHAFSKTVQDPEGDKFDLEFKKIESGSVLDQIEDLRKKYGRKDEKED